MPLYSLLVFIFFSLIIQSILPDERMWIWLLLVVSCSIPIVSDSPQCFRLLVRIPTNSSLIFLRFLFFSFQFEDKVRETEWPIIGDLPSSGSLPPRPQPVRPGQVEAWSCSGGRGPSTWATFHCLRGQNSREQAWQCKSLDLNWHFQGRCARAGLYNFVS